MGSRDPGRTVDPDTHVPSGASPPSSPAEELFPTQDPGPQVLSTDARDGLSKCARCGATEISFDVKSGMLRCHFCRHTWDAPLASEALGLDPDLGNLRGLQVGAGASAIVPSTDEVVTIECAACSAEVVIDTAEATQSRCHWCRNKLSLNSQMPNGAVPDMILPFKLSKDDAVEKIRHFVGKRKFFAHPRFRREFSPENVMGVYLPYLVVDANMTGTMRGRGEVTTRTYYVGSGKNRSKRYNADVYDVWRKFGAHVNGLTVEASSTRRNQSFRENTNNIINTIMPFDVENAVEYDSNYLTGFTSERRDSDIEHLEPLVRRQLEDISRFQANDTLKKYDRGVCWKDEHLEVHGQRWLTAYLPVWLYSYYETRRGGKQFLHYVAVNARTGETMGSVPLNQPKTLAIAGIIQAFGTAAFIAYILAG